MTTTSARELGVCHYCGGPADTRDHIVPRSRVPANAIPLGAVKRRYHTVPACRNCNHRKGANRSDCVCPKCLFAWATWGPDGWTELPIVPLLEQAAQSAAAS